MCEGVSASVFRGGSVQKLSELVRKNGGDWCDDA